MAEKIEHRWERNQMDAIFEQAEEFVKPRSSDVTPFGEMLKELKSFGKKLLEELEHERDRQEKEPNGSFLKDEKLRGTPEQIYEFSISAVFEQIAQDLTLISSAATQRASKTIKERLEALDRKANSYLDAAVKAGFFDKDGSDKNKRRLPRPTIITYFQKSPLMRVIPYSKYILVGLPYTCFPSEKETEVNAKIAREVGNLVFWQGYKSDLEIASTADVKVSAKLYASLIRSMRIEGYSKWVARSAPIIFADLYALKAIMDQSTKDNQGAALEGLFDDTLNVTTNLILANAYGDNINLRLPLELRPEVTLIALEEFYTEAPLELSSLRKKWDPIKAEGFGTKGYRKRSYTIPNRIEIYDKDKEFELSMDTALYELKKAAQYIWKIIKFDFPISQGGQSDKSLTPQSGSPLMDAVWQDEESVLDAMRKSGLIKDYEKNLNKWLTLFYADGWVMQSPGGNSGPH
ncbi:MAG: hypothetical protein KIH69_021295 [Anaerolineae bacterium]|nr:hypothetical protein [Anaerolineae bacterium]